MADSRALTIQSGQLQEIANADALIVGDGLQTPSGSGNNLTIDPDGSLVFIGVAGAGKTLDVSAINANPSGGGHAIAIGTASPSGVVTIGRSNQDVLFPGEIAIGGATPGGTNGDVSMAGDLAIGGGIDKTSAASLSIATATATSLFLSRTGQLTRIFGTLTVDEAATFTSTLNANGDVNLGNAASDTISFAGEVDTNITFVESVNRTVAIDIESTADTNAASLTVAGGQGGGASASNGGDGGDFTGVGGRGGTGAAGQAAGPGGDSNLVGGSGGTDAGGGGGAGGRAVVTGGAGTAAQAGGDVDINGGSSTGTLGAINIGTVDASAITLGNITDDPAINTPTAGGINMTGDCFIGSATATGAAVSGAAEGRIRYNNTTGTWQVSTQGAAYVDIATGSGGTPGGADTQMQYNNAGAFGGTSQITYDGTNITSTTAVFADGGIDRSAAATLSIGVTNANAITIGSAAMTTTVAGALAVSGDVDLGDAGTDTISFTGQGDTNLTFVESVNRTISLADETAVNTAGSSMTVSASVGGAASGATAGAGGATSVTGAAGGAGDGTGAGGVGGAVSVIAGAGGATGGAGGGAGGVATLGGGAGTSDGAGGNAVVIGGLGAGAAVDGDVNIGSSTTATINIANATDNPDTNFLGSGDITVAAVARIFGADGDTVLGGTAMSGTERLRVVGDCRIEGKLTVTGSIDPTDVQLSGGTNLFFSSDDGSSAAVSGAAEGRIRYNDSTGTWQVSTQTSAYADVTVGGGSSGAAGQVQRSDGSGGFLGDADFTFDGTNVTMANTAFTDGGIDRSAAGTLTVGTSASTTAITVGRVGILTTIAGNLQVDGTEDVIGASTFSDNATFNGNVTFGNAATDTVQFGAADATGSRIGPSASPNMHFVAEVNHTIDVDQSTTNTTAGGSMTVASGAGSDASGAGNAAGAGGAATYSSGAGGDGSGTDAAANGGTLSITSGAGGAGTASVVGGDSGSLAIDVGAAGATGGAGAGSTGIINIGENNASIITLGSNSGFVRVLDTGVYRSEMPDDTASAWTIQEGGTTYVQIDTSNAAEQIVLGTTATQTITLDGTVSITVPNNNATAMSINDAGTDYLAINTTTGSESVTLGTTATETITLDGTISITLPDNNAGALAISEGANDYLSIVTTDAGESVSFGNATTNPDYNFLGSGAVTVSGNVQLAEQGADPSTGANEGAIYTKDDGGVTQLFYRADSDGTVYQLTPPPAATEANVLTSNFTANENIAAGAPVNIVNDAGNPRIREGDADDAARQRIIGLAQAAILSAAAGDVVTQGVVDVPDAQWDAVPAVANVGSAVYLSTTVGNVTITAPAGNVAVVDVGTVVRGGTGAVQVLVNVKLPVKTI